MKSRDNGSIQIKAQHVFKDFYLGETKTEVLKDVCLEIRQGEFVSVMGPSGSGKSTLLYILGGLDLPSKGAVFLDGIDITGLDDQKMSRMRRQKIGFVFQFYNLIPNLNVEENVALPLLLDGKKMKEHRARIHGILETVGLFEKRGHTPRQLSGGQQQRVAIARALAVNPEILFADEPTGNLDSKTGGEIMTLLREINSSQGLTILMVTHSQAAAESGSRVIRVEDGMIR